VDATRLTYDDYTKLAKGLDVKVSKNVFKLNWKDLNLEDISQKNILRGIKDK
jgi:hypothetical protein